MTEKPLVTVIVPVYQMENYLERCVDSILGQTYRELEIILVDDGSSDRSPGICEEFGKRDPRIRVIHKKNGGVSSARNAGLQQMTGDYVTFVDSDDAVEPDWIENFIRVMRQEQPDVISANHRKCHEDGRQEQTNHETGTYLFDSAEQRLIYLLHYILTDRHAWEITTRLFKTEIIRAHSLSFSETCGNFAEDLGFLLEYCLYIRRAVSIAQSGYLYFIREGSMMQTSEAVPRLDSVNEVSLRLLDRMRQDLPRELEEAYGPILHFFILMNQYAVMIRFQNYHGIRAAVKRIRRYDRWKQETRRIFSCRPLLTKLYGPVVAGRILVFSRYALHRCWLLFRLERFLFFKLNGYGD